MPRTPATRNFSLTRWTLVLRADAQSTEGRAALSELCEAYYQPVFVFMRRLGFDTDTARDRAHSFFAHLLERGFPGADPQKGRFRSYLLGAVKYFVGDLLNYERREKRGGGREHEVIDSTAEHSAALSLGDPSTPVMPEVFDREWAVTVMNRAVAALETEHSADRFVKLRPWLMGDAVAAQAESAQELGLSEGAFKVAVHRLRKRFRELLRHEISQTVDQDADIDEELRYLCSVLGQ